MRPGSVSAHAQTASAFLSLYRTFLRATSASVLHTPRPVRNLRATWRSSFDDCARALRVLAKLEATPDHSKAREGITPLQDWIRQWERRVDGTLALLATAAGSRGVPHDVLKNMHRLVDAHTLWHRRLFHKGRSAWQPQLAADAPAYHPQPPAERVLARQEKDAAHRAWDSTAWNELSEVMRFAEARDKLEFGRVVRRSAAKREQLPSGKMLY